MAQDLLQVVQWPVPHHEVGGERVAEIVEPEVLDASAIEGGGEGRPNLTPPPLSPALPEEVPRAGRGIGL